METAALQCREDPGTLWAQHPVTAIPNAQRSPGTHRAAGQHFPAPGDVEQGNSLPPDMGACEQEQLSPSYPSLKYLQTHEVLVVCSRSSPVPISQLSAALAHCVIFFLPLSLHEFHSQNMAYQTLGRKVRHVNFDLSLFLAYETKSSLLGGAGIWDTASVGQHDWKAHSSLSLLQHKEDVLGRSAEITLKFAPTSGILCLLK